ncbi:trypsin-like peptidase domain-containing protein [Lutibacter sp. B2]|nr:trypsin-like peptidase domain-containing protein [Lutibacter sp. B2]
MIVKVKSLKPTILQTKMPFEDITNNERKQVLFCRYIGMDSDEHEYIEKLKELDKHLQSNKVNYIKFTKGLERNLDMDEIEKMKIIMDNYMELGNQKQISPYELSNLNMGYEIKNECLEWTKKLAFKEVLELYDVNTIDQKKTIRKNFGVKLLVWMNKYLKQLFENKCSMNEIHKIVFYGDIKEHELYFLILLSKLGCDILYINPKEDIDYAVFGVKQYSNVIRCGKMHSKIIPFSESFIKEEIKHAPKEQIIRREEESHENTEKSYEELAKLAESVVMINVYDEKEECIGTGSGVVISDEGFIITNFHVVYKGALFGVVFENDHKEYKVSNIVKYHTDYDLALIKVDRITKPIILNEKDLVRGQKIIAIGSPLGLFNTISDGMVSGFREFNNTKMVQITAPISPGSSGGALIDLSGKLVGITTSGLSGQNLNMSVTAQHIKQFSRNILKVI